MPETVSVSHAYKMKRKQHICFTRNKFIPLLQLKTQALTFQLMFELLRLRSHILILTGNPLFLLKSLRKEKQTHFLIPLHNLDSHPLLSPHPQPILSTTGTLGLSHPGERLPDKVDLDSSQYTRFSVLTSLTSSSPTSSHPTLICCVETELGLSSFKDFIEYCPYFLHLKPESQVQPSSPVSS